MIRLTILAIGSLSLMTACASTPTSVDTPPALSPSASTPAREAAPAPPASSVGRGSRGHGAVVSLQRALQQNGYYWGPVDGVYGSGTKTAVMNFQRDLGMPVTGVAGHKEWSALGLSSGQGEPAPPPAADPAPPQ